MSALGDKIAAKAETFVGTPFHLGGFGEETGIDCFGLWLAAAEDYSKDVKAAIRALQKCVIIRHGFDERRGINPTDFRDEFVPLAPTDKDKMALEVLSEMTTEIDVADRQPGDLLVFEAEGSGVCANYHAAVVCPDVNAVVQATRLGVIRMSLSRMKQKAVAGVRLICP